MAGESTGARSVGTVLRGIAGGVIGYQIGSGRASHDGSTPRPGICSGVALLEVAIESSSSRLDADSQCRP